MVSADAKTTQLKAATTVFFTLAALNFGVFVVVSHYIGGDALNGYSAGGRYYLDSKGHLTEVSRAVFAYSKWHAISLFVTHPLAAAAAWRLAKLRKRNPR